LSSKNSNLIHLKKIESSFMGDVSNWKTFYQKCHVEWTNVDKKCWKRESRKISVCGPNFFELIGFPHIGLISLWTMLYDIFFYIPLTIIYIHHTPRLSLSLTHILLKFKFFSYHFILHTTFFFSNTTFSRDKLF
jgi:hypothetical protein